MPAVSFHRVVKRFGSLVANDSISFEVEPGTVHVLLGENGAGKTTLLSMLTGFLRPDSGEIRIDGVAFERGTPAEALRRGVGLCAQHFLLAGALTGAENLLLGRPGCTGLGPLPPQRIDRLRRMAEQNGLDVPLDKPVAQLSVAEQERIEILKLLERDCRILVLDEPTSVLAPPEVTPLFETLRSLAASGRTILLVTHRLAEVEKIADRVTVLRQGRVVGEMGAQSLDQSQLVEWIAGAQPRPRKERERIPQGKILLRIEGLSCGSGPSSPKDLDLSVREGEIVGIGGVLGNGQNEIVEVLTGQLPIRAGSIGLFEREYRAGERVGLADEIAWIPDDRRGQGLALEMTCEENLRIGVPWHTAPRGAAARQRLEAFDLRPPDPTLHASHLSGGNQQRLLLAREFSRHARLMLAVHPTRGLDPGATAFVHDRLLAARAKGVAIVLVTGDLDELVALSDRISILFRGSIGYAAGRENLDLEQMNRALVGIGA